MVSDNKDLTQEWWQIAYRDLICAQTLFSVLGKMQISNVCYHCQQSAEKYLKGYLVFYGITPEKTHDLDHLYRICREIESSFDNIADQCSELTAYGVEPRYPLGIVLNEEDAKQAIECAEAIRNFITSLVPEIKDIPDV